MTDEEKKAIEFVKSELQDEKIARNDYQSLTGLYGNLEIETVLNIIEKQSKEIEELKRQIPQDKIFYYSEKDYTSNDKIKAKIQEVEQWELYNMKIPRLSTLDERLGAKIGIKYVLQSLLEKE